MLSWYEKTRFNLHLDHHATPENSPDLGSGLGKEKLRELLRKLKPDMVQYHSMGHPGWALFKSKYGATCPSLKKDFLKIWSEVCKEEDIKFGFYYSSGFAGAIAKAHPEWRRIKFDGTPYEEMPGCGSPLCFNSPYVDKVMIPFLKELIEKYDATHFWLDGDIWSIHPCWCKWCRAKFKKVYGHTMPEDENNPQVIKFQFDSYNNYLTHVKKEIKSLKSDILLCGNWAYTLSHGSFMNPSKAIDWISGDIPVNLDGFRRASAEAAYISALDIPFDLMTWDRCMPEERKTTPLPKSLGILKAESSVILAHGGRVFLWHNPNKDCSLYETQWNRACELADFVRNLAPFTIGNKSIAKTGILCASRSKYLRTKNYKKTMNSVYATAQILQESMIPYSIFNEANLKKFSSRYNLIIVPEAGIIEKETVDNLKEFASSGGKIIMIGIPEIVDSTDRIQTLCGLKIIDKVKTNINFKLKDKEIYELRNCEFYNVIPTSSKVKQKCCKSLNEIEEDGRALVLERDLGKGTIITLTCDLCSAYFNERYPKYRDFLAEIIDDTVGHRQVYVDTIYPIEVVLNNRDSSIYVHFVNNNTGRPNDFHNQHIDDMLPSIVKKIRVLLNKVPKKAVLLPQNKELSFNYENGYASIELNITFKYYLGVKFEF